MSGMGMLHFLKDWWKFIQNFKSTNTILWLHVKLWKFIISSYRFINIITSTRKTIANIYKQIYWNVLYCLTKLPKVTWWKIVTFLGYHLHWLTSLETSRHFRKIALRLGIFLAMFRECLYVVARQLAPKCRDFSNVAKLARQCKWP